MFSQNILIHDSIILILVLSDKSLHFSHFLTEKSLDFSFDIFFLRKLEIHKVKLFSGFFGLTHDIGDGLGTI